MEIVRLSVSELITDPNNVRVHDEKNLDAIAFSLAKFGQQKPIVVGRDRVVIAGNGTLAAARRMGWYEIDAIVSDLTGGDAMAYAIADNRSSDLAEWDRELLQFQIKQILDNEDGFIDSLHFDQALFDEIVSYEPVLSPDISHITPISELMTPTLVDSAPAYAPVVEPKINVQPVTQEQLAKPQPIVGMINNPVPMRSVTCPKCGEAFDIHASQ